jgi:hypothetical protein
MHIAPHLSVSCPTLKLAGFACAAAASNRSSKASPGTIHGGLASIAVPDWRSGEAQQTDDALLSVSMMFEDWVRVTGYNVGNAV